MRSLERDRSFRYGAANLRFTGHIVRTVPAICALIMTLNLKALGVHIKGVKLCMCV